jgi:integrase
VEWGSNTTINDAIKGWKAHGWDDLSPSTSRRYASIWKTHIEPSIGRSKIADLGPYDVEQWLRRLKRQGLSEASVRQARAMLHRACRLARKWSNNTLENPIADTEMPQWSYDESRDAVRSPDIKEVRVLLRAAEAYDQRIGAFVRVVAATGARRGEVAALRWDDIDWEHSVVRFDEASVVVEGGVAIKRPKTKKSVRSVAVDAGTLACLTALLEESQRIAEIAGVAVEDQAFVFSADPSTGSAPYLDNFTQAFSKVREKAGVASDIHLHSLRHFQSTALDAVITEAQKQARMGWTTVQMARHYTDAVTAEDRKAADHIGVLLSEEVTAGSV